MNRLSCFCLITLALLLALPAAAAQVQLSPGAEAYELQVLQSSPERSLIHLRLNHFELDEVMIAGQRYQTVALGQRALHYDRGLPALPTIRESLLIPDDAAMQLRIVEVESREFGDLAIAPSKGHISRNVDPALVSYVFDDFYGGDGWYPADPALLDTPYILRDTRGIVLELNPFQYNPSTRTLRVATAVTVEVFAAGSGGENVLARRPARRVAEFEKLYASHYLNYEAGGDRYDSIAEAGPMLVITYDAFHGAVQPFVDWKNQMGIPTTLVDVSAVGSTGAQIKTYIQGLYDSEGLCFVLLVGDAAQVPYISADGSASDPSYGFLAGADYYPELFVGRFSAENAGQVDTQVQRSIEYERDPQAGAAWYAKGIGIGSAEGSGIGDDGESDKVHIGYIRDDLLAFTYTQVDEVYDPGASSAQVASGCNDGRSIINYCGHGWIGGWSTTGFDNNGVNALVNDNMLPFINSVACNTGEFQSGTCFGEAWMRATNGGEPTGAVAFYGSTISMSWAPPMAAQDETIDLMVADAKRTFGALSMNGSCQMVDEYGASGENEMRHWTIFGDPSLRVRTAAPAAVSASHFGTVDPLMGSFTVDTEPGNLAALSYQGAFIGSAFADAAGEAVIPFVGELPMPGNTVTLTVTGFNRATHVEEILVGDALTPTCDATPGAFYKTLNQDQVQTDWLHIANNGEAGSTLWYSITMDDPNFPVAEDGGIGARNMSGSYAWTEPDAVYPGTTLDLTVFAYNGSTDNEWIKRFEMDLPPGVILNSATNMTGGSGGDLPWAGALGDGALCVWQGVDTYGEVYPGETGQAVLNLTFASMGDAVTIPYTITGDIWGSDPHEVSGEITITTLGPNVTVLSPNGGELCAVGDVLDIEWAAGGGPTLVDVELTRDGLTWEYLAEDVSAALGSYAWTVTAPITAAARVRVCDALDPGVADASDEAFTIYRTMTWVAMDVASGSIPQGESDDLQVVFDSNGLPEGVYETTITIHSNAGADVVIPATVEVIYDLTDAPAAPAALRLAQNHPNPFNPKTVISFATPAAGRATLRVFDVEGRLVTTLLDEVLPAASHHVVWDGSDDAGQAVATGVYFYRLDAGEQTRTRKMLLLK